MSEDSNLNQPTLTPTNLKEIAWRVSQKAEVVFVVVGSSSDTKHHNSDAAASNNEFSLPFYG